MRELTEFWEEEERDRSPLFLYLSPLRGNEKGMRRVVVKGVSGEEVTGEEVEGLKGKGLSL